MTFTMGKAHRGIFIWMGTRGSVGTGGTHDGGVEQGVAREKYYMMTRFLYCFNSTLMISSVIFLISSSRAISSSSWPSSHAYHFSI
jgi:hypothetical protein